MINTYKKLKGRSFLPSHLKTHLKKIEEIFLPSPSRLLQRRDFAEESFCNDTEITLSIEVEKSDHNTLRIVYWYVAPNGRKRIADVCETLMPADIVNKLVISNNPEKFWESF